MTQKLGMSRCMECCTWEFGLLHQLEAHVLQHEALYGGVDAAGHHNASLSRARHILEPHIRDGPHLRAQQQPRCALAQRRDLVLRLPAMTLVGKRLHNLIGCPGILIRPSLLSGSGHLHDD